ncbi:FAD binding domain-containing protein [Iningainema tapete]|uniref:Xanthine dehydrogenase family protein subunit M n=1 Tax=Iningainema tapete BLCC-T55 TaxID=2748662 RepID=A0A8J6XK28_9CYAN|nr:xanthine dehydrogenase family protein subunit M [Iningainema tapete]MBD2774342.1 xanthine dehydrogenase family protein subunit M [Iningainema tapete BLCC-T55]
MHPFSFVQTPDVNVAINAATNNPMATFIGGGTALLDMMKDYVERHECLIDINRLPFSTIELTENGVRIGALVRNSQLAADAIIQERYPALSETILYAALPQIRNMATVGGNLMQRTRCSYFRDTAFGCNKRVPGSGCPAIDGINRGHALLGTSEHCIASHASSMAIALVAFDAVLNTQSNTGTRRIPLTDFYLLPGDTPHLETVLQHGEMITSVDLPTKAYFAHSTHAKVRDRQLYSNVTVVTALDIKDNVIQEARIALGGVASIPWRAYQAEAVLVGTNANEDALRAAADAAVDGMCVTEHNQFKVELTKRLVVRSLRQSKGEHRA